MGEGDRSGGNDSEGFELAGDTEEAEEAEEAADTEATVVACEWVLLVLALRRPREPEPCGSLPNWA